MLFKLTVMRQSIYGSGIATEAAGRNSYEGGLNVGKYLCLLSVPFLILWTGQAQAGNGKHYQGNAAAAASQALATAAPEDLMVFGDFDRSVAGKTRVTGVEVYEIDCDQGAGDCIDNLGNSWEFGTPLPQHIILICETDTDISTMGCVHAIEITVYTVRGYRDVFAEVERAGCETNEVVFDETAFRRRGTRGGVLGSIEGGENQYVNVSFTLGRVGSQRPYTLVIRAPEGSRVEGCNQGMNAITGIGIVGTSTPDGRWHRLR